MNSSSGLNAELATAPGNPPLRVLVVDDESELAELVATALRISGCEALVADRAATAIRAVRDQNPDAVVLDYMLPDMNGEATLVAMRKIRPELPVVFLTARGEVQHRVAGLRAGADDYLTKPFSLEELIVRLAAVLRRSGRLGLESRQLTFSDLQLDPDSHQVRRAGAFVELTPTEFELLRFLMVNARTVVSKTQILDRVWDYDFDGRTSIVELYIGYLRKKIDKGHSPLIHTIRGVGYVLRESDRQQDSEGVGN